MKSFYYLTRMIECHARILHRTFTTPCFVTTAYSEGRHTSWNFVDLQRWYKAAMKCVQPFKFNSASLVKHNHRSIYTYRVIRQLLIDSGSGCTTVFCADSQTGRKTLSSGKSPGSKRQIPLPERNSERQRKIGISDSAAHSLVGSRSS